MTEDTYQFFPTNPAPPAETRILIASTPGAGLYEIQSTFGSRTYAARDYITGQTARFVLMSDALQWLYEDGNPIETIPAIPENWNIVDNPELYETKNPLTNLFKRRTKTMRYTLINFANGQKAKVKGWRRKAEIVAYCNSHLIFPYDIDPQDIVSIRFRTTRAVIEN